MGNNLVKVIFGLGSNLGNKEENILNAISILTKKLDIKDVTNSDFFYSNALLLPNSPPSWNIPFANSCMSGKINFIHPLFILSTIKSIEAELGRDFKAPKWSPRIIDIDIIKYGNISFFSKNLTIPHKEFQNRDFVKTPLEQIS